MILLTTSRGPTRGIRIFYHDLTHSIPDVVRISRGKLSVTEVAEKTLENNTDKVIIVDRWKNRLGKNRFFNVSSTGLNAVPPLVYFSGIRLQKTFRKGKVKTVHSLAVALPSEKYNQTSKIAGFLSDFLSVPILTTEDALVNCQVPFLFLSIRYSIYRLRSFFCRKKLNLAPISVFRMLYGRFENEGSRGHSLKV